MKKRIIWQNTDIEINDDVREDYKECHDLTDEEMESVSDDTLYDWACETNAMWLDDERSNLNIHLHDSILVFANLGLWHGRVQAYKIVESGNIADCLECTDDYMEFYCDDYDMKAKGIHHDGTNYYTFRVWKEGLSEVQKENFLDKIYMGKSTHKDILRYTSSLRPYISAVYGWGGKKPSGKAVMYNEFYAGAEKTA